MALPKIMVPTFTCVLPSTNEEIEFRPFLVKEEKILLIAKESGDKDEIYRAVRKIINNCVQVEGFNINKNPLFDMEYLFIKIRSKSVDNIAKFEVTDSDDGITYELTVDLDSIEVLKEEGHSKTIMVTDDIGMVMKYPTSSILDKLKKLESITEITYETICECIDYIFDKESVYPWVEQSVDERNQFLETLDVKTYDKIQEDFFNKIPRIEHYATYTNSAKVEKKVVFRTLEDFFILG